MSNPLLENLAACLASLEDKNTNIAEVINRLQSNDAELIAALYKNEAIRDQYFITVDEISVCQCHLLTQDLQSKSYGQDQYTGFNNKIRLSQQHVDDVVLDFPYKDNVLVGAQTKETQSTPDRFLHKRIHADEIDLLLEPKAFTNWKRYTVDGPQALDGLSKEDNLIIKGNNLMALYSLRPRYAGQVKLIYIDPPYNTTNDSFRYLDRFSHSSWLTFMRNRLEIAKELLSEDGLLWISISDREAHYLKVLCDEIMGRDNFVADIIWNSTKSVTNTAVISDAHTHTLLYAADISELKQNRATFRLQAEADKFSNPDNDPRGKWVADPFQVGGERPNQLYPIINPNTGKVYHPLPGNSWKNEKKVFDQLMADGRIVFGTTGQSGPQRKRFWSEAKDRGKVTTTLWKDLPTTTNGTQHLKQIFGEKVFDNPKPEALLERIIQLSTEVGDFVLDYHLGSGTTAAAAHKMGRRYIGIEQMDYIEEVSCARLQSVIQGEQGGISKSVEWKGGGSFVYAELYPLSAAYIGQENIEAIYKDRNIQWDYRIEENISELIDSQNLSENEKQQAILELLDLNMLYLPYSEMMDSRYQVNEEDQKWTDQWYDK